MPRIPGTYCWHMGCSFARSMPKQKILIAEDEDGFRALVTELLGRDHEVVAVSDGNTALETLLRVDFDLVVLDVDMPGMTGIQLLERLRKLRSDEGPSVIITSGLYEAVRRDAELQATLGVRAVLHKPFTVARFRETVERVLAEDDIVSRTEQLKTPDSLPVIEESRQRPAEIVCVGGTEPLRGLDDETVRVSQVAGVDLPERASRHLPDLIVVMSESPEASVAVATLKANLFTSPVPVLAAGPPPSRNWMLSVGADAFFDWPDEQSDLLREARRYLERARRRRHARVRFHHEVRVHIGQTIVHCDGIDLSESGVGVLARAYLEPNSPLSIELRLPTGTLIVVPGHVANIEQQPRHGGVPGDGPGQVWRLGLEFGDIAAGTRNQLRSWVQATLAHLYSPWSSATRGTPV